MVAENAVDLGQHAGTPRAGQGRPWQRVHGRRCLDVTVVTEVPNDETAAKMALGTAMQGNVRTMTMRAFGREEMDKIVGSLP